METFIMLYRLFLYEPADQEHIEYVNSVLNDPRSFVSTKAADYMSHINSEDVIESIRSSLGGKCKAIALTTPGDYGPRNTYT